MIWGKSKKCNETKSGQLKNNFEYTIYCSDKWTIGMLKIKIMVKTGNSAQKYF